MNIFQYVKKLVRDKCRRRNLLSDLTGRINQLEILLGQEPLTFGNCEDAFSELDNIIGSLNEGKYLPETEWDRKVNELEIRLANQQMLLEKADEDKEILLSDKRKSEQVEKDLVCRVSELEKELSSSGRNIEELQNQLKQMLENEKQLRRQLSDIKDRTAGRSRETNFVNLCNSVVGFRDQLFSQQKYAEAEHDEAALKIIGGIIILSRSIMEDNHIRILDGEGKYESALQCIAGVCATETESMDMQIKETVREGYMYEGKIIRQQEVLVYRFDGNGK